MRGKYKIPLSDLHSTYEKRNSRKQSFSLLNRNKHSFFQSTRNKIETKTRKKCSLSTQRTSNERINSPIPFKDISLNQNSFFYQDYKQSKMQRKNDDKNKNSARANPQNAYEKENHQVSRKTPKSISKKELNKKFLEYICLSLDLFERESKKNIDYIGILQQKLMQYQMKSSFK